MLKEKAATRARDALAAERRRQPMMRVEQSYEFEGPTGVVHFADLFEGRRQLIVYHFMLAPGALHPCVGCSEFVDNIGHLAHLQARDTSLVLVSRAPYREIAPVKQRMRWTVPWFSIAGSAFNDDFDVPSGFGLNLFFRHDESILRGHFLRGRGTETLGSTWSLLDLTPLGRQERWEDSPEGWPQKAPFTWSRWHDDVR